jgi:hypothetical protein
MIDHGVSSNEDTLVIDSILSLKRAHAITADPLEIQYLSALEFKGRSPEHQTLWTVTRVDSGRNQADPRFYVMPDSLFGTVDLRGVNLLSFTSYLKINGLYVDLKENSVWLLSYNGWLYRTELNTRMLEFKHNPLPYLPAFAIRVGQLDTSDGWQCLEFGRRVARDSVILFASNSLTKQRISFAVMKAGGRWKLRLYGITETKLWRGLDESWSQGFALHGNTVYALEASKAELTTYRVVTATGTGLPDSLEPLRTITTPSYPEGVALLDTSGDSFLVSRRSGILGVYLANPSRFIFGILGLLDHVGWHTFPYLHETVNRIQDLSVDDEGHYWATDEHSFIRINRKAFRPAYLILQEYTSRTISQAWPIGFVGLWSLLSFLILRKAEDNRDMRLKKLEFEKTASEQFGARAETLREESNLDLYHDLHNRLPWDIAKIIEVIDRIAKQNPEVHKARTLLYGLSNSLRKKGLDIYPSELMIDSLESGIRHSLVKRQRTGRVIADERMDREWPEINRLIVWRLIDYLIEFLKHNASLIVETRENKIRCDFSPFDQAKAEAHPDWYKAKALIKGLHGTVFFEFDHLVVELAVPEVGENS